MAPADYIQSAEVSESESSSLRGLRTLSASQMRIATSKLMPPVLRAPLSKAAIRCRVTLIRSASSRYVNPRFILNSFKLMALVYAPFL